MTLLLGILILVVGALIGAGTVALCVAAADGDQRADVARFLAGMEFSSFNQGRQVLLGRHDFNRLARLAALANQPQAWLHRADGTMEPLDTSGARSEQLRDASVASHADDWPPNTAVPCTICSQMVSKADWLDHYWDTHNVAAIPTPRFDVIADWYFALQPLPHPVHGGGTMTETRTDGDAPITLTHVKADLVLPRNFAGKLKA